MGSFGKILVWNWLWKEGKETQQLALFHWERHTCGSAAETLVFGFFLPSIWHTSQQPECELAGQWAHPYHVTEWNQSRASGLVRRTAHTPPVPACKERRESSAPLPSRQIHWATPKCPCFYITIGMKRAPLIWKEEEEEVRSGDQSLRVAQPDYLGHTLLCLIKNAGWRDLLRSRG